MDNDRVFAIYALILTACVTSSIAASLLAGFSTLPSMGVFLEHLAMSLVFRGAYKSFDGFDWVYSFGEIAGMITVDADSLPNTGAEAVS